MRHENQEQELGWAPKQYPGYNTSETGEWRMVTEDDVPVAVIWTNNTTGAGVSWLRQTDKVMEMRKLFLAGAESGMPAADAYGAVESKFESLLGSEMTGTLDGVNDTLKGMMQRLDGN